MDHDHHHPQNPNPCDTHFSDNFDALPEFEFSDFLLLDDGSAEEGSPENLASSDNVIDGSMESAGASPSTHSNMNKNGGRKGKADQAGSRVAFRTKSDLEVMDDGYKWRKYGKKMVKNSPNPRNYYKCASGGCNVKKRVERDGEDPSYVITTYDGMHNHESPCVVYYNQPPLVVPNGWTLQPPSSSAQSSPC
ncbi:probable WRKY transcription factor 51 [Rhododendron vialii]|uniref:probable WRKY transcription factor 51 n=1 Tax=Rhododendron vialii TaxID=182163 RepID=UPI00265F70E3|nr:probable WRKY transcription factor 51 [Rhododendron vialii]